MCPVLRAAREKYLTTICVYIYIYVCACACVCTCARVCVCVSLSYTHAGTSVLYFIMRSTFLVHIMATGRKSRCYAVARKPLQHTATHCITLKRTATHTLPEVAAPCSSARATAMHYNSGDNALCGSMRHYDTRQHTVAHGDRRSQRHLVAREPMRHAEVVVVTREYRVLFECKARLT